MNSVPYKETPLHTATQPAATTSRLRKCSSLCTVSGWAQGLDQACWAGEVGKGVRRGLGLPLKLGGGVREGPTEGQVVTSSESLLVI